MSLCWGNWERQNNNIIRIYHLIAKSRFHIFQNKKCCRHWKIPSIRLPRVLTTSLFEKRINPAIFVKSFSCLHDLSIKTQTFPMWKRHLFSLRLKRMIWLVWKMYMPKQYYKSIIYKTCSFAFPTRLGTVYSLTYFT